MTIVAVALVDVDSRAGVDNGDKRKLKVRREEEEEECRVGRCQGICNLH